MGMKTIGLPGKDLFLNLSLGLSTIVHRSFAAGIGYWSLLIGYSAKPPDEANTNNSQQL
jgi:hypothetical protein